MEDTNFFVKPNRIFNLAEKRVRLTLHKQERVIERKGQKGANLVTPKHR